MSLIPESISSELLELMSRKGPISPAEFIRQKNMDDSNLPAEELAHLIRTSLYQANPALELRLERISERIKSGRLDPENKTTLIDEMLLFTRSSLQTLAYPETLMTEKELEESARLTKIAFDCCHLVEELQGH